MSKGIDALSDKWTSRFTGLRARLFLLLLLVLLPVYIFIFYSAHQMRLQAETNSRGDALALTRLTVLEQDEPIEITRQQLIDFAQFRGVLDPKMTAQCNRTFAQLLKLHPLYNNIGVINPDGTLRCSAVPVTGQPNFSDRSYFRAAMSAHVFSIGDYLVDRVTGKSALNLAYPILDAAHHTRAVVFIGLSLGVLSARLIETSVLPQGSTITIVDGRGTILARQPDPEKWVGRSLPQQTMIRNTLARKQGGTVQATGLDGVERLYVYATLRSSATNPVYVSVGIPTSVVFADAQQHFTRALMLMALVTAVVIAAGWFGSRILFLQPIAILMRAASRLGQGDLSARAGLPYSADEFGRLAHSLDDMAASLQARQSAAERAEQELRQKDQLLAMVGTMAKVGGWEFDARTLKGTWTDEVARIHETDPKDQTSAEAGISYYREGSRKIIEAAVKNAIERGQPYDLELEITTAKGNHKWVRTIGRPVKEDGAVIRVQGSFQDITERKQAQLALQESEERFRTMANSMSQLAWIARADGYIFWYNQRWYEYTGTTPEQMEGWGWQSVHDPEVLPEVMENWKAAIDTGQPFEMEFPLRGADGQFRTFLTRGQPLKDSAGQVMEWFGTNTDVDKLKQAEEKVRQLNAGLEQRVIERTAELQATNNELESFSYSVSHDLRAPLRSIDGFSQALLEDYAGSLDDQARGYLNRVRAATQRMGDLIDDMLTLSRVTRAEMVHVIVDLSLFAADVLAELQQNEPDRKVVWHIEPGMTAVGDAHLLRVMLLNLLGNAWKFTGKTADARIEFGATHNADDAMEYFVRDNGAGFDMTYAGKLFSAFQRLHRADEFQGTGIGLATVKRIIHRHGGQVRGAGATGKGATFYFTLPG